MTPALLTRLRSWIDANPDAFECCLSVGEVRAIVGALEKMRTALDGVMIGGNHLANTLVQCVGPDFARSYPPDMDTWEALERLGACHDVWCCWAAIMRARAASIEAIEVK